MCRRPSCSPSPRTGLSIGNEVSWVVTGSLLRSPVLPVRDPQRGVDLDLARVVGRDRSGADVGDRRGHVHVGLVGGRVRVAEPSVQPDRASRVRGPAVGVERADGELVRGGLRRAARRERERRAVLAVGARSCTAGRRARAAPGTAWRPSGAGSRRRSRRTARSRAARPSGAGTCTEPATSPGCSSTGRRSSRFETVTGPWPFELRP